jgi:flavorubredoxin
MKNKISFDFLDNPGAKHQGGPIYEDKDHQYIWLGFEEESQEGIVQVNQYLIIHKGSGTLLDAGGVTAFPQVLGNLSRFIDINQIQTLFYTHQDPDVVSGISLWMDVSSAQAYIGSYWKQFLPHLGLKDMERVTEIPDEGMRLDLDGGDYLEIIPAHFLHSLSNFQLYDSRSQILFTGDLGGAIFPEQNRYIQVQNFQEHKPYMEAFHKRFMSSSSACKRWVEKVKKMEISALAPQHGAILTGGSIEQFYHWLYHLECGVDLL